MAVDDIDGRPRVRREGGKEPMSKHQIKPGLKIERADAGRDGRTCLARPKSQA